MLKIKGQQHYKNVSVYNQKEPIDVYKQRDLQKVEICKEIGSKYLLPTIKYKGITLIEIPYWWDRKYSSLAATVYSARPDLFTEKPQGIPIAIEAPFHEKSAPLAGRIVFYFFIFMCVESTKEVIMTATEWDYDTMEPNGWFMTEKYDGMRIFWNGSYFISRTGKIINVPESITMQFPPVPLDCELW